MNAQDWTDEEIREYYDQSWNIQLWQLAGMTGKTIAQLKRILMP